MRRASEASLLFLAATCLLVAFYVWGVGSGKPAYITKPHGVPTKKDIRTIMRRASETSLFYLVFQGKRASS